MDLVAQYGRPDLGLEYYTAAEDLQQLAGLMAEGSGSAAGGRSGSSSGAPKCLFGHADARCIMSSAIMCVRTPALTSLGCLCSGGEQSAEGGQRPCTSTSFPPRFRRLTAALCEASPGSPE